jgi:membrane fusion protein (multidrug efflux system)
MFQKLGRQNFNSTLLKRASMLAISVFALTVAGCNKSPTMAPTMAEVGVIIAQTAPVATSTELPGRTSAYLVSDVRPQIGGIIQSRLFTEGSYVTKGQALYKIDPSLFRAQYSSALASLAQAKAGLSSVALRAQRYAELVKINGVSKQENDDAQAALAQARASVQAAEAAVQTAKISLNYSVVTAPISGRIGKSNVTPGALVTASQPTELARVQDISRIYLDINQSVNDIMAIKQNSAGSNSVEVELVLDNGTVYPERGVLQFSDISVDEATGTVNVRAIFPNSGGTLLPGMFARARFATGTISNGILVPQIAVTRDPKGNATVMIVGKDNKVAVRPVNVSQTVGDKWLITGGLQTGDQVIVEGLQKAMPGAPVKASVIGSAGK